MQRRLEKFREMDRKSKEELESLKNAMKMEALSKAAIEHERLQKELEEEEKNAAIRMEQLMIRNENHAKVIITTQGYATIVIHYYDFKKWL